jgi:hypothetical protein
MVDEKEYLAWISDDKEVEDKPTNEGLVETDFTEVGPTSAELEEIPEELAIPKDSGQEEASELEKTETEADAELEKLGAPIEVLEEQEVFDDPVRKYLHEIGLVHLLTAVDEKVLAKTIQQGKHLSNIIKSWLKQYGRQPAAADVIMVILQNLGKSAELVHLVQEQTGILSTNGFIEVLNSTNLREMLDNSINQSLVFAIANKLD